MSHPVAVEVSSPKSRTRALVLCIFFGWCGLHLLYVGRYYEFVGYLISLGFFVLVG